MEHLTVCHLPFIWENWTFRLIKSLQMIVSFHLGSFREDLRLSNFVFFLVCSADLDIICCGSFSTFIHHFQRDHNYAPCLSPPPPPPTKYFITIVPSFFFLLRTAPHYLNALNRLYSVGRPRLSRHSRYDMAGEIMESALF